MNFFVTGTDTGVGKTVVSCALLHAFAAQGRRTAGYKPVAAGVDADGLNDDAKALRAAGNVPLRYEQVNPYCLREAIAPHLAAARENVRIELPRLIAAYRELSAQAEIVMVEGAGGFLVPLDERFTFADLAHELNLPVILVVGMRLGCLNHALLTVQAIRARGLQCVGWVANVLDAEMGALDENIAALQSRLDAPLLGIVPWMAEVEVQKVVGCFDVGLLGS